MVDTATPPKLDRAQFAQKLTNVCLRLLHQMCDIKLRTYQEEMADRFFFSLIYEDSDEITVEASRQAGKTETLACVVVTAMVMLPILAKMYPEDEVLEKFRNGVMIGVFAPIDFQANTIFSRIESHLTSEYTKNFLHDPEIDDEARVSGDTITMKRLRSFCRRQTAHAKAKIESTTYHFIIIDEAQDADSEVVRRRIHPMTTATAGTIVMIGTPTTHTSYYFDSIQYNKRRAKSHGKRHHFAYDWRRAAKESRMYKKAIQQEMRRLGRDSDEFRMSYELVWLLDRGMFITEEQLDALGDTSMKLVTQWTDTPIVIGIDVARKHDSTVITPIYVDWDHPDEFGLYYHVILSWLELHGENWESQYRQICDFVDRFNVFRIGVESQGMGGPVAERLQVLLPRIEVIELKSDPPDQSERWKHLMQLIQRGMLRWPAHKSIERLVTYQRFRQQMLNVEKIYKGKNLLISAPENDKNAHDDYLDSLALGTWLSADFNEMAEAETWGSNPFMERGSGRR